MKIKKFKALITISSICLSTTFYGAELSNNKTNGTVTIEQSLTYPTPAGRATETEVTVVPPATPSPSEIAEIRSEPVITQPVHVEKPEGTTAGPDITPTSERTEHYNIPAVRLGKKADAEAPRFKQKEVKINNINNP